MTPHESGGDAPLRGGREAPRNRTGILVAHAEVGAGHL